MTKYAQNGGLTRFDTGGSHSQNPNGGIDIGNNNSVEENETKQNNFVYSNRIFLDSNIVSQYNLPKSLVGKSVADATKFIDDKFKGRNDKISQSTKNGMLSKIAEAQEAMKPQEPEMEQGYPQEMTDDGQMAWGGFADSTIGQGFGEDATADQKSNALGAGLGVATTALDLGNVAFGKPTQNTDGLAASTPVNKGGMIAGSAMKGASAGMAFGPLGAGVGAAIGGVAGLIGAGKAKKAALKNTNNYAVNVNKQFSDQYAMGGEIDPMYYENLKLTPRNTAPIESISNLKPAGTTVPYTIATQPKVDISNANRQFAPGPSNLDILKYNAGKVGNYVNENAGNLARYAPIAANALQLAQLKKPQGERLDRLGNRYKPEYVDEASLQNIADQTMNNSVNAIGQSGASQGQTRASILGSQLQRTKALSDAYSNAAAQNRQQNAMAQEFNLGVDQVNLQQSNTEKDINARNQGAYDTEKSKLIGKIGENIGNVGTEQAYKKIAITTTGYNWLGEFQKMNPNATKEETVIAAKKAGVTIDDDKTVKKQALGGYLIKNKVK